MSRSKLSALKRRVKAQQEKTKEIHDEQRRKRVLRNVKTGKMAPPRVEEMREWGLSSPDPKPKKKANSADVERWFREALFELKGRKYVISQWSGKQKATANRLLKTYGDELVEKAVKLFVESWPQRMARSRGRLYGEPTIMLLYGMRDEIFAEAQEVTTKPAVYVPNMRSKHSDEYDENASKDESKVGW